MSKANSFDTFLSNIRLTKNQRDDLISGHTTLRRRLLNDTDLSSVVASTFLQGSYRRSTAVKPKNGKRADVDVIVVTNLNRSIVTPEEAIEKFIPFVDKYYRGKYEVQGRSIGIELSYVDLDIVITSAPSEVDEQLLKSESVTTNMQLEEATDWRLVNTWLEPVNRANWSSRTFDVVKAAAEWKSEPLWIPDRDAECWVQTHPLEQIRWTRDKNKTTNKHFVNVVKALKWWRTTQLTSLKYPKGYPIEHMIGDCCPDNISSVADGVVKTLEAIVSKYYVDFLLERVPTLPDRGVPDHNVWKRIESADFITFYKCVKEAASTARKAFDAVTDEEWHTNWRLLFGSEFPPLSEEQARAQRLAEKTQALVNGQSTLGKNLNVITGTAGVSVPKERSHYDETLHFKK